MSWQPPSPKSAAEVFEQHRNWDSKSNTHANPNAGLLRSQQTHWISRTQYYLDLLTPLTTTGQFPRVLLAQRNPIEFLAGFMATCITECPVFLGNPNWSAQEWHQVLDITQPHHIWGDLPNATEAQLSNANTSQRGWIMISTGGSSGGIKFAIHTWATLSASVAGFQQFFDKEQQPVSSCCVLPLYHVSGLMQFMRAFLTGGQLILLPFAECLSGQTTQPDASVFLQNDPANFFLSLVPTQLQRLLEGRSRIPWLQQFPTILLGGAPAWSTLLDQAKSLSLNLAPTYGMTETASQIATLKPAEFLLGHWGTGRILPHAHITIHTAQEDSPPGLIEVRSRSLFQGYYPQWQSLETWVTDDIGTLDAQGYLTIQGRNSRKILSGGENIFPEEIEATLQASGLVKEVCVLGIPDNQWGEAVTALYVPIHPDLTPEHLTERLKAKLVQHLSPYKHPKRWICLEQLPRNAQGKLDYQRLKDWANLQG